MRWGTAAALMLLFVFVPSAWSRPTKRRAIPTSKTIVKPPEIFQEVFACTPTVKDEVKHGKIRAFAGSENRVYLNLKQAESQVKSATFRREYLLPKLGLKMGLLLEYVRNKSSSKGNEPAHVEISILYQEKSRRGYHMLPGLFDANRFELPADPLTTYNAAFDDHTGKMPSINVQCELTRLKSVAPAKHFR
jgi:hypothetical protein